ncbi:hypothetical protein AAG747_14675 [Rapidithrix thailandica]|uniref:Ig-like domain-containing protein n=1 Tax=Rapidithrix thailandica TaxID=413964 RepID=A0AAW9S9M3_9BACT
MCKNPEIIVADGNKYTNSTSVDLSIHCDHAYQMLISNQQDFSGAKWVAYQKKILNWALDAVDGDRAVYIKFRDENYQESKVVSDNILLDLTPPQNPLVSIEVPGKATNDPSHVVDVSLQATDAKYFMISNQNTFIGKKWRLYQEAIQGWQLEKGNDGYHGVYVKFRDVAGNETDVISDQILIDTEAPVMGKVVIDQGAEFTIQQNRMVELSISARNADSMMVSQEKQFGEATWEIYQTQKAWTLTGDQGPQIIYVKFKDKVGNESETASDEIVLDTTPPSNCMVVIDNGAPKTHHLDKMVELKLLASDAQQMIISNHSSFKGGRWRLYQERIPNWRLDGEEDGYKSIYVRFKDKAGNVSSTYKADIILERGF